jgi:putative acetyltransferase
MEGYVVRKVVEGDNALLAAMIRATFTEHDAPVEGTVYVDPTTDRLFELFQKPRAALWVAVVDGRAEACCGIYPTEGLGEHCAELVKFYSSPKVRGRGIGRRLLEVSIQSAKQMGYTSLYLESLPQFAKAVNMYEKLGFKPLQQPLGYSGHCGCNIWMLKDL